MLLKRCARICFLVRDSGRLTTHRSNGTGPRVQHDEADGSCRMVPDLGIRGQACRLRRIRGMGTRTRDCDLYPHGRERTVMYHQVNKGRIRRLRLPSRQKRGAGTSCGVWTTVRVRHRRERNDAFWLLLGRSCQGSYRSSSPIALRLRLVLGSVQASLLTTSLPRTVYSIYLHVSNPQMKLPLLLPLYNPSLPIYVPSVVTSPSNSPGQDVHGHDPSATDFEVRGL